MQRTEKYFENDAFRKTAAGVILAAEADAKTGGGRIALDGTVFYPEGGGQPADRGTLTLADGTVLHVTDVHETNGIIWHTVDALPETAQPGAAVTGTIDWEWRFDKMQQHTGEHILSGILHQMFGAENVGFHIGSDAVRMDTSVPISAEGLREAELAANRIIWENVPVLITYPTPEELAALTSAPAAAPTPPPPDRWDKSRSSPLRTTRAVSGSASSAADAPCGKRRPCGAVRPTSAHCSRLRPTRPPWRSTGCTTSTRP